MTDGPYARMRQEFAAIRDNPDLTEDEKIAAVSKRLGARLARSGDGQGATNMAGSNWSPLRQRSAVRGPYRRGGSPCVKRLLVTL